MKCSECGREYVIGEWPFCPHGFESAYLSTSPAIHPSDRVVVYRNPQTGEVRIPGRGDRPIHPKYAAAGFERQELSTIHEVRRLEKEKGLVSEVLNYDRGSGTAERDTGSI